MMDKVLKSEGAGLILSRKVGERIIISANDQATAEELVTAIKAGIVISLVDVNQSRGQNLRQDSRVSEAARQQMGNRTTAEGDAKPFSKGSARIGLKASPFISIAREEILDSYIG